MTDKHPHLKNAPIKEAMIQVQIEPAHSVDALKKIKNDLAELYPTLDSDVGANQQYGHKDRLWSKDRKTVLRCAPESLSMNQLPPYTNWDEFFNQYKQAWNIFTHRIKNMPIGPSVRFINQFSLPNENLSEMLCIGGHMHIADGMGINSIFTKFDVVIEGAIGAAIVTITPDSKVSEVSTNSVNVTFDIMVKLDNMIEYNDISTLEASLESLRIFKNNIFFDNILKAKEMFG